MYALTTTVGDGSSVAFAIPFTFQDPSEIKVTVNDVDVPIDNVIGGFVYLVSAPSGGAVVRIMRNTNIDERAVDFKATARLKESDLDNSNIQIFNALQEAYDRATQSINL